MRSLCLHAMLPLRAGSNVSKEKAAVKLCVSTFINCFKQHRKKRAARRWAHFFSRSLGRYDPKVGVMGPNSKQARITASAKREVAPAAAVVAFAFAAARHPCSCHRQWHRRHCHCCQCHRRCWPSGRWKVDDGGRRQPATTTARRVLSALARSLAGLSLASFCCSFAWCCCCSRVKTLFLRYFKEVRAQMSRAPRL